MPRMFPWQSAELVGHPYYPRDAAVAGYVPNHTGVATLLAYFAASTAGFLSVTALAVRARYPAISTARFALALWFAFSGFVHVTMEAYSALNHGRLAGAQDLLGQLWKEYAKADSRYVTAADALPFCVDALTAAVVGPLCFWAAHLAAADAPARHPVALVVSACQLCGSALYLATAAWGQLVHGRAVSRPEPLYFWGYLVGCNATWVVVPLACIVHSSMAVVDLARRSKDAERVAGGYVKVGRRRWS